MDETTEVFRHLPFPYPDGRFPRELGAVVQVTVLTGRRPALEVVHTPDGSWLVGDGVDDPNLPGASVVTHLAHAVERNGSIAGLATMPPGSIARRAAPGSAWVVTDLAGWDD